MKSSNTRKLPDFWLRSLSADVSHVRHPEKQMTSELLIIITLQTAKIYEFPCHDKVTTFSTYNYLC